MRLTLVTAPLEEPITLAEARAHLRVTATDEDAKILALIFAAREYAENFTGRALVTQTWDLVLECFPRGREIRLPKPPLQQVVHVKYRDVDNVEQTLATSDYQVDADDTSPRIVLATNKSWPDTYDRIDAVTVRFKAGYGGTAKVPYAIQAAMLLLIGHWFENREAVNIGNITTALDFSVEALLYQHRIIRL